MVIDIVKTDLIMTGSIVLSHAIGLAERPPSTPAGVCCAEPALLPGFWVMLASTVLHPGTLFMQEDMDKGHLWFVHAGILSPTSHDGPHFYLMDGKKKKKTCPHPKVSVYLGETIAR